MTRNLITGNDAAAWGARLARVDHVLTFPLTSHTEIVGALASWIEHNAMAGKLVTHASVATMLSAAAAAADSGIRVFAAITSQSMRASIKMLYDIAGRHIPMVLLNLSRGMAEQDCGCLQIQCATCQEILDGMLLAYRLAEHSDVRLPVVVNIDGVDLSAERESVDIPNATTAKQFVGSYSEDSYEVHTPMQLTGNGDGNDASFEYGIHHTIQQMLTAYDELASEFRDFFGRYYPAVDAYRCDDADFVFVMLGAIAIRARETIDRLRDRGWKVGLLRPRLVRPFPRNALRDFLTGKQAVAVIEENAELNTSGMLHNELTAILHGGRDMPTILARFTCSEVGGDISTQEFFEMATVLRQAAANGESPPPRLLFTHREAQGDNNPQITRDPTNDKPNRH